MGVKEKEEHRNSPVSKMILQALPDVLELFRDGQFLSLPSLRSVCKMASRYFSTIRSFMNVELLKEAFFRSWKAPFFCVLTVLFFVLFYF